ncbi:MAG: hypothetical protein GXY33_12480 [Phycisphaerae bacterium]|nr:hypothetical protein [Phycisphaerae bacterium]
MTAQSIVRDDGCVEVSHGWGIPFGGIGTGYSVFGQYGYIRQNFDSTPDYGSADYNLNPRHEWDYAGDPHETPDLAFCLTEQDRRYVLQQTPLPWLTSAKPFDRVRAFALLPKGLFLFEQSDLQLEIALTAFSPMIPHDLDNSSIPVQVFDFVLTNRAERPRRIRLDLRHRRRVFPREGHLLYHDPHGQIALACVGGLVDYPTVGREVELQPGESQTVRFVVAWHYPHFKTNSPNAAAIHRRYYTRAFADAAAVIERAVNCADDWSAAIDRWHQSYRVPAPFKRVWLASLASVMTSTMLSDDPYFYEVETPHRHVCTMDVNVYSSWLYMINWPQIERMEMDQFLSAIPTEGERKGYVWHSLWDDPAHYVEEPTFLVRVWRDALWFNDQPWMAKAFPHAVNAAECVYRTGNHRRLLVSTHGNQSYDVWKMPGISAYVNLPWLYGLGGLACMAQRLGRSPQLDGQPVGDFIEAAAKNFDELLWNASGGYWNCFHRTPDASRLSTPDSLFTDQLFGRWAVLIDANVPDLLPREKVEQALLTLYRHNLIEDPKAGFRGWVNGLLPGRRRDTTGFDAETAGYHAYVCWICAQLDLGSLLGHVGREAESLDVFNSFEASLHNNHLAVGEYNQSIDDDLNTRTLPEEPGKDTPRFPPYPRYKCAWEYLVRILGLSMDFEHLHFAPFRTIDFAVDGLRIAETTVNIRVQRGWTRILVDGRQGAAVPRDNQTHTVECII